MDNQEISRLKARGKAELLAFVLFLTLLGGAVAEYRRETAPLAMAAVVLREEKPAGLRKVAAKQYSLQRPKPIKRLEFPQPKQR